MSNVFNTNTLHNVLNVVMAATAAGTAFLIASGCTTAVTGTIECSQSWINPAYTAGAIAVLGGLKIVVNIARDGFAGLIKPQPPVGQPPVDKGQ
jgi:hypothetical protein